MGNTNEKIEVSVLCAAYNHEKYIRDTLEGFVIQKTNFKFEVLVHDDASTDRTAEIINEYQKKYPNIIKPIFQKENQYSKGIKIGRDILAPRALGQFIALCEGDDCWIDKNKLQMQYDYMIANPECTVSTHNALLYNQYNGRKKKMLNINHEKDYYINDFLNMKRWFPTASIMIHKRIYINRPKCIAMSDRGDYPLLLYGVLNGYIHYFPDVMSKYNYGVAGSWTERNKNNDICQNIQIQERFKTLFQNANEYSNFKYDSYFKKKMEKCEYQVLKLQKDYESILRKGMLWFLILDLTFLPYNIAKKVTRHMLILLRKYIYE